MKRSKVYGWLPKTLFEKQNPLTGIVVSVEDANDEIIMRIDINKTVYQISLYGERLNSMIHQFGEEDSKWIGKQISISHLQDPLTGKVKISLN